MDLLVKPKTLVWNYQSVPRPWHRFTGQCQDQGCVAALFWRLRPKNGGVGKQFFCYTQFCVLSDKKLRDSYICILLRILRVFHDNFQIFEQLSRAKAYAGVGVDTPGSGSSSGQKAAPAPEFLPRPLHGSTGHCHDPCMNLLFRAKTLAWIY